MEVILQLVVLGTTISSNILLLHQANAEWCWEFPNVTAQTWRYYF